MVTVNPLPEDKEISKTAIQFENKIGGGQFGEVRQSPQIIGANLIRFYASKPVQYQAMSQGPEKSSIFFRVKFPVANVLPRLG